jgi:hypothetical protein
MEKRGRERKQCYPRYHARLCEKALSLKALGSVASYLENGNFYSINDSIRPTLDLFPSFFSYLMCTPFVCLS